MHYQEYFYKELIEFLSDDCSKIKSADQSKCTDQNEKTTTDSPAVENSNKLGNEINGELNK